ncbi:TetR/AcrR family transcriptional regulator [Sporosarcina sp. FSL K6-2383]|uniref:TetR/AcrR family transcriptional regulator n=1 Tax=Sporosarcina sp. FSL K6-2383 TaxID=2921556 RepID=UPI00315A90D5
MMSDQLTSVDRRIRKSKAALKEALLTLMRTKDFKKISITDIVQLADLNRGTFYKHYQYKEELLEEIIDDVMKNLTESYRAPYEEIGNFDVSKLTASAIKIFQHVATYASFYTLLGRSNSLTGFQTRICDELTQLLFQDLSQSHAPLNSDINPKMLASYQAYAIWGMIIEWIDSEFHYTSDYMAEQLLVIVQRNP